MPFVRKSMKLHTASKQGPKRAHLVSRRIRSLAFHAKGEGLGRCVLGRSKLRTENFDLCPCLLTVALKLGQSRLLDGKFLKDGIFRAHHWHILASGCVRPRSDESGDRRRTSVSILSVRIKSPARCRCR